MMEYSLIAAFVALVAITTLTLVGKEAGSTPAIVSCFMCIQRHNQQGTIGTSNNGWQITANSGPAAIMARCRLIYNVKPPAGLGDECTAGFYN